MPYCECRDPASGSSSRVSLWFAPLSLLSCHYPSLSSCLAVALHLFSPAPVVHSEVPSPEAPPHRQRSTTPRCAFGWCYTRCHAVILLARAKQEAGLLSAPSRRRSAIVLFSEPCYLVLSRRHRPICSSSPPCSALFDPLLVVSVLPIHLFRYDRPQTPDPIVLSLRSYPANVHVVDHENALYAARRVAATTIVFKECSFHGLHSLTRCAVLLPTYHEPQQPGRSPHCVFERHWSNRSRFS